MFKNALFATVVVFIAVVFYLMDELRFLIPYRDAILERHGGEIALFSVVLFLNLLAVLFVLTGRIAERARRPQPLVNRIACPSFEIEVRGKGRAEVAVRAKC